AEAVAFDQSLERRAALAEAAGEQQLAVACEQIEGDINGRRLGGQARDARSRRMDSLTQRIEVLAPVGAAHDDLTVEHVAARREAQLGEVAAERFAPARLQEQLLAIDECQAAKPVELDLVHVAVALGQLLARQRQLGLDGRRQRQAHRLARLGCTRRGSPFCLRKCGGQGASPRPSRSSRAASSSSESRRYVRASMSAEGSPRSPRRTGTLCMLSSAGSTSATSSQSRGQDTRASATARTE